MRRILEAIPWWTAYAMGATGMLVVGIPAAIAPNRFEAIFMLFLSIAWIVLAAFWARLAKSSIKHEQEMLAEINHLITYITMMNRTMKASLDALSTYDRDKAVELASELNTYTAKSLYDSYWREEIRKGKDA